MSLHVLWHATFKGSGETMCMAPIGFCNECQVTHTSTRIPFAPRMCMFTSMNDPSLELSCGQRRMRLQPHDNFIRHKSHAQ